MRKQIMVGTTIVVAILMAASVEASGITFHGSDLDGAAAAWRTTTTAKPLDVDGDNVYGTAGYATWLDAVLNDAATSNPGSVRRSSLPTYVSSFSEVNGSMACRYNNPPYVYAEIDDTTNPSEKTTSSTLYVVASGGGTYTDLLSFTVGSGIENVDSFVFGVMADNLDFSECNSSHFMLTSSLGNSHEITLDSSSGFDKTPDFYFFTVEDAVAGETFTLSGKSGTWNNATVAAVTWDTASSAVPEPSVMVLLLGGLTLLIFRRVKQ